jgi:hypothetical protein
MKPWVALFRTAAVMKAQIRGSGVYNREVCHKRWHFALFAGSNPVGDAEGCDLLIFAL